MAYQIKHSYHLLFVFLMASIAGGYFPPALKAQSVSVSARMDSTLMVIGGQMDLTIEILQPDNVHTAYPNISDTISEQIEVVSLSIPDTTYLDNQRLSIIQTYRITSFDSGLHYIPPMQFDYVDGEMAGKAETEAMALMVVNPFEEVDPEKGFFDIKRPFNLPFILSELWRYRIWILSFLLLAALIVLGIYYWKNRKIPLKEVFFPVKPKEPPHIVALRSLDKIKNDKLWQTGQVKFFHSELTDTLRRYLEDRYHFSALEQTTGEILNELGRIDLPDDKLYEKMEKVLRTADLAKFAKYEPLPDENDYSLISAYFFVNQTKEEERASPEETVKKPIDDNTDNQIENKPETPKEN